MSVGQVRTRRSRIPARHPTGLYVHSSPPTVLPVPPSVVRQWLRGGEITRLTDLVLKGLGQTLVGEYSPDSKARKFIHVLPKVLKRIDTLHDAGRRGDIETVETILSKEPKLNLVLSRDCSGLGLLHKAVILNHISLQEWLLKYYPATINVLDKEKRNPLHYAGGSVHPEETWKRLVAGGADINCIDNEGYTPAFYMHHPRRLRPPAPDSRGAARRQNSLQNMIVKPSTIRIWIHDKDLGRLQKVLWEGLGDRLRTETSTNPLVRRFLNAVPYIMGSIKEIHTAAVNNDLELLVSRSEDPVPKDILLSKDVNGLTPLHKAAGLGHMDIAREILRKAPEAANMKDSLDRTPLHYAAALKDQGELFQFLVDSGSIDHLEDKRGNTPSYYHGKPAELEGPKLLTVIPEAPRTAHIFPPSWDWKLLGGKDPQQDSISAESPQETLETEDPPTVSDNQESVEKENEEEQTVSAPASQEEEQEEEVSARPDISEDEGVGSEVPVSGEEVPSPQSDTTNEEYEVQQEARLADSVNLSDQPLASNANVEIGNDSGNEDGKEENEVVETVISNDVEQVNENPDREDDLKEAVEENNISPDDTHIEQNLETPESNSGDLQQSIDEISLAYTIQNSYGIDRLNSAEKLTKGSANYKENGQTEDRLHSTNVEQINEIKTEEEVDYNRENKSGGSDNVFYDNIVEDNEVSNENNNKVEEINEAIEIKTEEENTDSNQKRDEEEDEELEQNSKLQEQSTTPESENVNDNQIITETGDNDKIEEEPRQVQTTPNNRLSTSSSVELVPLRRYIRSAEVLAITPADPEEMDDPELQEAVAGRTPESSRKKAYELVKSGDMEAMAELVLSGQGASLLGLASDNPDVQLFINNVPHYIAKIERVHKAAREGDLRAVQTALDRRKFAVARDNSTPLKPTPLHVAALFGRTSILRYLAGRFPETMHAQDSAGRTPLHYAATLPDNGHFYSLLVTLGADKAFPDNAGRTPEEYVMNKGDLTRETLLAEYQNRDIPIDMSGLNFNRYSDKVLDDTVSSRQDVDEEYQLAQMDLCFKIIQHKGKGTLLEQFLTDDIYQKLRSLSTRLDNTLLDILRPGIKDLSLAKGKLKHDPQFTGITIPDYETFRVFEGLIIPIIKYINGLDEIVQQPNVDFYGNETPEYFLTMNLDPTGYIIKSCIVEVSRNLIPVSFAKNLKLSDLERVEVALTTMLTGFYKLNKENILIDYMGENIGVYYSLGELVDNKEVYTDLEKDYLLPDEVKEGDSTNWPYGRGVFISALGDVTGWINIREHLKLMCTTPDDKRGYIGIAYKSAADIITLLEERIQPVRDPVLGLLATDPKLVGAELVREGYPIFNSEEGQYLAESLGEPLIKGLTEVAQIRPKNPVVHLAHYLLSYDGQEDVEKRRSISSAEEVQLKTVRAEEPQDNEDAPLPPVDVNDNEESAQEDEEQDKNDEDDDSGSDTVDEPAFKAVNRDEHGQSMLHFAAARAHGRNAMFQLLQEMDGNVGLRDALYRTPRDVASQLDIEDNVKSIDKYVVTLAARGEDDKLKELMVEGYDHILDVEDGDKNIFDIVSERDNESTLKVLQGITAFEERREKLHRAIRFGSWQEALEALRGCESPRRLATAKNQQGRCALHVAVLSQNENIVEHVAKKYPASLRVGDNLMRTPLHYAMGVEKVEPLSRILIAAGAQRVLKDLKGRQPSYYFMNKTDIQKLQDEEEALRV